MYAIGHTSHTLISLSDKVEKQVTRRKAACKTKFKDVFYRTLIKNETWSFVHEYEEAKLIQAMLFLDGPAG